MQYTSRAQLFEGRLALNPGGGTPHMKGVGMSPSRLGV